jgi:hypothetical protein
MPRKMTTATSKMERPILDYGIARSIFFKGCVLDRRISFIEEDAKRHKYSAVDTDVENATPRCLLEQQKHTYNYS